MSILVSLGVLFGLSGCSNPEPQGKNKITIFKSAQCGCCVGYSAEMQKEGFQVEVVSIPDMHSIKERYNIPQSMESCHTTIIGDYFVEGHVPVEAINKLMDEKPDIDGIALPRMPAGSPGMPGTKAEPFHIYAVSNGEISDFMII